MAVRIRLTRTGRRNRACYRIGAFDSRTRRDGRCLEILGHYDPIVKDPKEQVTLDADRVKHWLSKLNDDPKLIVSAAAQAQKALDLIQGRDMDTEMKAREADGEAA